MGTESPDGTSGVVHLDAANPWPGLAAYDETATWFFKGRAAEAAELLQLVQQAPLTVLYGRSGLGKTSLLQAGLFPLLRSQHFLPVYLLLDFSDRTKESGVEQIAKRLTQELDHAGAERRPQADGETLWEYLHREDLEIWSRDNFLLTPVLVFDQFEELFSRSGGDVTRMQEFIDHLTELTENRIPAELATGSAKLRRSRLDLLSRRYRIVLSFREDYLGDVKTMEPRIPSLLRNYLRLEAMTRQCAIDAVQEAGKSVLEPAEAPSNIDLVAATTERQEQTDQANAVVGQGVAASIVDVVSGSTAGKGQADQVGAVIEPALLSLFCYKLNQRRGAGRIDEALVRTLGQDILRSFYREALEDKEVIGPPDVSLFVEEYLVQGDRFRGAYPKVEAIAGGLLTERQLDVLTSRHRLLRVVPYPDTARIELIHDCLVPVACNARDERHFREDQDDLKRRQAELEQQVKAKEDDNRRLKHWKWGLSAALVFCILLVMVAYAASHYAKRQQKQADVSARRAMAYAAIGGSYQTLGRQQELSTLLALQAMSLSKSIADSAASQRAESILRRASSHRLRFERHLEHSVHAVAFSPDGKWLAAAAGDHVRTWDAQTFKDGPLEFAGNSEITSILFSADGTRLVSGDDRGGIGVWDVETGEAITPKAIGQGTAVSALALHRGGFLASASLQDGGVTFWDLAGGDQIGTLPPGADEGRWVSDLAFSPDGHRLAVGEVKLGAITVWDVRRSPAGMRCRPVFRLPTWKPGMDGTVPGAIQMLVDSVAFSPDGKLLATGDRFNAVNLWDAGTVAHLACLLDHIGQVRKVAFSPNGTRLASASDDGTVIVWDVASGRSLFTVTARAASVVDLAFSRDGQLLATASLSQVSVWDVATHGDAVFAVAFSPGGERLATGSGDNTIKIWNTASRRFLADLAGHVDRVQSLSFSPDGRFLASASFDKTMRVWDLDSNAEAMPARTYSAPGIGDDKFYEVTYSPDGRWLATAGANGAVVLWDAGNGSLVLARRHEGQVWAIAFSPDGRQLVSVGGDCMLKIWEVPSGALIANVRVTETRQLLDVDFSPAGDRLVITIGTDKVLIMSLASRQVVETLECDSTVTKARFTPDGKSLLLIGPQAELVIRRASNREPAAEPRRLLLHTGKVNDVAVSRDGQWIATASDDRTFHVSPLDTGQLVDSACAKLYRTKDLTADECQRYLGVKDECPQPPPCVADALRR